MATVLKKAVASLDKNMVLRSTGEILENVTVVLLKFLCLVHSCDCLVLFP